MTPYLSRLRPADRGPRLRSRPRSTFEPAPLFPIDGPPIAQPGAGVPPTWAPAGAEIEAEQETPYHHPAGSAVAAVSPSDPALLPAPTEAPGPAARAAEDPAKPAATAAASPIDNSPPSSSSRPTAPHRDGDESPWSPGKLGRAPAPWSITRQPSPPPPRASTDEPRHATDRSTPDVEPAPPESPPLTQLSPKPQQAPPLTQLSATPQQAPPPVPPADPAVGLPAPNRKSDRPVQQSEVRTPQPDASGPAAANPLSSVAAQRVQAIAQRLHGADAGVSPAEARTPPPHNTQPAAAPPVRVPSQPSTHTELTVTIGRIEVKATAPDPTPPRAPSGRTRRQPPSLEDYLVARARARGRTG
jgi:hypothetical protein